MHFDFINTIGIIFVLTTIFATLSVFIKQPFFIGYILSGIILGPYFLNIIKNHTFIEELSHIGIILLLFLAGLTLHPQKLKENVSKIIIPFLIYSSSLFFISFLLFAFFFKYSYSISLILSSITIFSSTILVVKMLPTIELHQKKLGSYIISFLILQDIVAIIIISFISSISNIKTIFYKTFPLFILLITIAYLFEKFILSKSFIKIENYPELLFNIGIGWSFILAIIAKKIGLSYEIGAFTAGVILATNPISFYISEKLKPLRDFFLLLFFFALGVQTNLILLKEKFMYICLFLLIILILKPIIFRLSFRISNINLDIIKEMSIRVDQMSEFGILIAITAYNKNLINEEIYNLISLTIIISFILSSYLTSFKYPSPISPIEELKME